MADSYVETVAGEIADITLADQAASGDITIVDVIANVLGASSQTLEEAFLTAVRVRRAEARARELLAQRAENNYAPPPKPSAAPMQHENDTQDTAQEAEEIVEGTTIDMSETDNAEPKAGMPRRIKR